MKILKYLTLALLVGLMVQPVFAQEIPFATEIAAFKEQDKTNPPQQGEILFVGSSSIRKWTDLAERFPDKQIIRRGVGGSQIWQWVKYYTPDMILAYKPSKVFIYVGENDLAEGKPAADVLHDFETIYTTIQKQLPTTKVYFMAIKPSPGRANVQTEIDKANKQIKNYLKGKTNGIYIDTATPICGPDYKGDKSLFEPDGVHLNSKGYDRWQQALKKYL